MSSQNSHQPRTTALVTGAGRGIGQGIARRLAASGLKVALADIDGTAAEQSAAALRAEGHETIGIKLDVVSADDWARSIGKVLDAWGMLEVLVNNAGISPRGTAAETDEALWDQTLAINLKGPWLGIKAALPSLRARAGTIINIGSTRATRPLRGLCAYCTSKAGLVGLTQQVAIEYLDDGVTSNMVAPGWVDTPGERVIQARHGRADFPSGLRNLTTPDDVGDAVVFLTSPAARRINGLIMYVDTGLHTADDVAMVYDARTTSP